MTTRRGRSASQIAVESNTDAYIAAFRTMASQRASDRPMLTREAFVDCMETLNLDLRRVEIGRVFSAVDEDSRGEIDEAQFLEAIMKRRFLRRIATLYLPTPDEDGVGGAAGSFSVPVDFDWTRSTAENYAVRGPDGERLLQHFGEFASFRAAMDYEYHECASRERQLELRRGGIRSRVHVEHVHDEHDDQQQ